MSYTKEELCQHINNGMSYEAIGRLYNISGAGIKKACKKYNIPLLQRRTVNSKEKFDRNISLIDKIDDTEFKNIIENNVGWLAISIAIGYKTRPSSDLINKIKQRCHLLNIVPNVSEQLLVSTKTKGELKQQRGSYQSYRSSIQKDARNVYFKNTINCKCYVCGYDKHVEVAHINPVSAFSDDTKITDINSIDNLVGLCPNCHWEYDNNKLVITKNICGETSVKCGS